MRQSVQDRIKRYDRVRESIKNVPDLVDRIFAENKEIAMYLNRDQFLLGRDSEGNLLTPDYQQDPYFKSPEAAQAYARMKYALQSDHDRRLWIPFQLYPDKPMDTPNLIVTGSFQDAMFISVSKGTYTIGSSYKDTSDINSKYKNTLFGLSPNAKHWFYREYFFSEILKSLQE